MLVKTKALIWMLLAIIAIPVLIPMAIYVKKNTLRMPKAKGDITGTVGNNQNDSKTLTFIGDSPVAGVGIETMDNALASKTAKHLAEHLNCVINWHAIGKNGIKITKTIDHLVPLLQPIETDYLVVSLGVNDTTALTGIAHWQKEVTRLIDTIESHSRAKIFFMATPDMGLFTALPFPLGWFFGTRTKLLNAVTQNHPYNANKFQFMAMEQKIESHFLAEDGFHPSEAGCDLIGKSIAELIYKS